MIGNLNVLTYQFEAITYIVHWFMVFSFIQIVDWICSTFSD